MRHKWKYGAGAKCLRCGVRIKDGPLRPAKNGTRAMVKPALWSDDDGQTWSEGDPPACREAT